MRSTGDALAGVRLEYAAHPGNWDLTFAAVAERESGSALALAAASAGPPPPPATLFGLDGETSLGNSDRMSLRVDRLSVGYSTPSLVVRVGRQALSWGAGLAFHPMDLVDPFAPDSTDTEYKPGVDMVYGQVLFDDGSDLQLVGVPRPAVAGGPVSAGNSTWAGLYRRSFGDFGATVLLARDRGDTTAGLGLSGPLGGAGWNVELVPTWTGSGAPSVSGLANISGALPVFGHVTTLYAEYFRNGFGIAGARPALDALPVALTDRMARGQLFTIARDSLAAGASMELTPLMTVSPTLIADLNDGSTLAAVSASWSLSDNATLGAGVELPFGRAGTEYGGLYTTTGSTTTAAPPRQVWMRLQVHF